MRALSLKAQLASAVETHDSARALFGAQVAALTSELADAGSALDTQLVALHAELADAAAAHTAEGTALADECAVAAKLSAADAVRASTHELELTIGATARAAAALEVSGLCAAHRTTMVEVEAEAASIAELPQVEAAHAAAVTAELATATASEVALNARVATLAAALTDIGADATALAAKESARVVALTAALAAVEEDGVATAEAVAIEAARVEAEIADVELCQLRTELGAMRRAGAKPRLSTHELAAEPAALFRTARGRGAVVRMSGSFKCWWGWFPKRQFLP